MRASLLKIIICFLTILIHPAYSNLAFRGGFLIDFAPFFMVLPKLIFWIKNIEYILRSKADSLFLPDKVTTVPKKD